MKKILTSPPNKICPYRFKKILFDIETNGLEGNVIHCIVAKVLGGDTSLFPPDKLQEGIDLLSSADVLIGHNIIGFDIPVIKKHFDVTFTNHIEDTLVLSRLANPILTGGHSLDNWGYLLYPNDATKRKAEQPDSWEEYTEEMGQYCIQDVELNADIYYTLLKDLKEFSQESIDLEHAVAKIIKEQEVTGFMLDEKKVTLLSSKLKSKMVEIEKQVHETFLPKWDKDKLVTPRLKKDNTLSKVGLTDEEYTYITTDEGQYKRNAKESWDHHKEVNPWWAGSTFSFGAAKCYSCGDYYPNIFLKIGKWECINGCKDALGNSNYNKSFVVNPRIPTSFYRMKWTEFNLASRKQIGEYLEHFGWQPKKFTLTGQPIVDESTLEKVKGIPEATLIAEFMMLQKRVAQVTSWLELSKDSRVHGFVIPNGARTGRMTHRSPNVAQTPGSHKPYGKECRECWAVPQGYKLVGIDASGLELRVLAHYMKDKDYINEIINTDIHSTNQRLAGLEHRNQAKTFIFSLIYGGGDTKLGKTVGGGSKEGAALRSRFYDSLPSLRHLTHSVTRAAQSKHYLKALDRRIIHIRKEKVWTALNTLLQGGGAVVMKVALVLFNRKIKENNFDAKFVANIHDEWQLEVLESQAEQIGKLGVDSIIETGKVLEMLCPLDGEYKIGNNWNETH